MNSEQINKEIQRLKDSQKLIELWEQDPNKPKDPKYLWEHELGWIDMQLEIDILELELRLLSL